MTRGFKQLSLLCIIIAVCVVGLGAFTRLSDAGLGCPDWPGCYGFLHIPTQQADIQAANRAFPERPYEFHKAWPEMVHRYFASTLGLVILLLTFLSWRSQHKPALGQLTFMSLLVIFQGLLGMWTVTMKLHPLVVMTHLMGGFTTLALTVSLYTRLHFADASPFTENIKSELRGPLLTALSVLLVQIMLGGWTAAQYAATACLELPICHQGWWQQSDFVTGFQFWLHEADNWEYGVLTQEARIAVHAAHRIGAMLATVAVVWLLIKLWQLKHPLLQRYFWMLGLALVIQLALGVNNIVSKLPLANATAHNLGGAFMFAILASLVTLYLLPTKRHEEMAK
jgi:cytochrome c oxidase assembly protein subunit 15